MENNIFEIASKEKYRFPYKGQITVEDLWDLSAPQLDVIYKALKAEEKTAEEDSLLGRRSKGEQALQNKIEIVRHVFAAKQEEIEARKLKAANDKKKRRIMEQIASKEDAALGEKSIDDLKKMLSDLG